MKRPYLGSRSFRRSGSSLFVIGGAGIAIVLVLIIFIRIVLPGVFVAVSSPFLGAGSSMTGGVGSVFSGFGNAQALTRENAALAAEVRSLSNENAVLTSRAQDLTKLLGGGTNGTLHQIVAGVLSRPPESPYDTLLIAAGTSDGVTEGALVFGQGGVPLGTIKHVYAHSSQVALRSTAGLATEGWVGQSRLPLTIVGAGGGAFTAVVPKTSAVVHGDTVYAPGPGALPIGTVAKIDSDPSSPTVSLRIQPLLDLFTVTWVQVASGS